VVGKIAMQRSHNKGKPLPQQRQEGLEDQSDVKKERGPSQVFFSESDLVRKNVSDILLLGILGVPKHFCLIPVLQRGQVCKPRQDIENLFVVLPKQFYILQDFWAWTDKAHLAPQDIEKLGKFINLGLAQNPT
jgi:hypothetical protein